MARELITALTLCARAVASARVFTQSSSSRFVGDDGIARLARRALSTDRRVVVFDETYTREVGTKSAPSSSSATSSATRAREYTPRYKRHGRTQSPTSTSSSRRVFADWERANTELASASSSGGRRGLSPARALSVELNREITSSVNAEEILEHVRARGHLYNMVNCATAWHRVAKMHRQGRVPRGWRAQRDGRVEELEIITRRLLTTFEVQNLSNLAWSCAVLGYRPRGDLLTLVADEMEQKVDAFYPQAVTNTLWAYTTLKHPRGVKLAEILAPALLANMPKDGGELTRSEGANDGQFSTQAVSNALWTYASLGVNPGEKLLDGLASWVANKADTFKAQELSNSAWAYAQLLHHPGDATLAALERCLLERREEYTTQALANTSIGLAYFGGSKDGGLKKTFEAVTPSWFRLSEGNSQDISNITWAIASVGAFESSLYKAAVRELFRRDLKEFVPEGLKMIYHAMLMQHDFDPDRTKVDVVYPEWVQEDARKTWLSQTTDTRVSTFQHNVEDTIKSLGLETVMEDVTADGLYSIDISVRSKNIAVECDGPSHYYSNLTTVESQKTKLRNQALVSRGWDVMVVPYYEWHDLWKSGGAKEYLRGLLQEKGAIE